MNVFLKRLAQLALVGGLATSLATIAHAEDKTVRIGFQKYGSLILLKATGALEEKLKPLGYSVSWTEFPAGPQMLEALNVGSIDFGTVGETPPIFAQAAGAPLVYVGYEPPAPKGEAILVPKESPLKSVADLKGKTVALNKGSNVHYLLVKALEKAGLSYADITTSFLVPADARAAFERGAVDAWVIWDPFQAAAEATTGARVLADGTGIVANHQIYVAARPFVETSPEALDVVLEAIAETDEEVKKDPAAAAAQFAPLLGIPQEVLEVAVGRQSFGIRRVDNDLVAAQQQIADVFFELGLIPSAIKISDATKEPKS